MCFFFILPPSSSRVNAIRWLLLWKHTENLFYVIQQWTYLHKYPIRSFRKVNNLLLFFSSCFWWVHRINGTCSDRMRRPKLVSPSLSLCWGHRRLSWKELDECAINTARRHNRNVSEINYSQLKCLSDRNSRLLTNSRMEQNYITEIPSKAFTNYRRLRRIDLSNNNISRIAYDAFSGLKSLNSLVLYGNKIKELPAGVFKGLTSLQLLLLNANEISCIRKDSFKDLSSLSLLSLYDNNIQSLSNGTFDALKQIQTM